MTYEGHETTPGSAPGGLPPLCRKHRRAQSTAVGRIELMVFTPCGRGEDSDACAGCDCGLETRQVARLRSENARLRGLFERLRDEHHQCCRDLDDVIEMALTDDS